MWRSIHVFFATLADFVLRRNRGSLASDFENNLHPQIKIVAFLAEDHDRSVTSCLCYANHWEVFLAATVGEAGDVLGRLKPQIVLLDRDLGGPDWRNAVSALASCSNGACIVLISKMLEDNLWNDVVSNGGYEVLPKPLREDEVFRAVKLAWNYWKSAGRSSVTVRSRR
jgi:DNA-binding response OmpR family regulator